MNITIRRTVNLNEPILPEAISAPAYEGESYAHTFIIDATKDGEPCPLSGFVTGFFERSDRHTVRAQGEIVNGEATLTLPPECYAIDGKCTLTIMLVNGSTQTVIYAASGTVKNTKDGPIINGGEAIPSYEEIMEALSRYMNANVSAKVEQTDEGAIIRVSDVDGQTEAVIRNGERGAPGKTAYEIAVEHGFKGTEEEWLESLKGGTGIEDVELDDTLTYKDGRLAVNTANELAENNMLPITSAAAYAVVGNIHEILKTI